MGCRVFSNRSVKDKTDTSPENPSAIKTYPLRNEQDLDILIKEIGEAKIVLLGESTHGTREYYTWRTAITKRLIAENGFDFIAVEADWTDSYKINQLIRGPAQDSAAVLKTLKQYDRWPSSMWGNYEMASLIQWLNSYNQDKIPEEKSGFYGLDLYSFWEWTRQNIVTSDTGVLNSVKQVKDLFSVFNDDALRYADTVRKANINYSSITERLWGKIQKLTGGKQPVDEAGFLMQQQAFLTLNGEYYFREMVNNRVKAINLRDGYMAETIKRLLVFHGNGSKAIIWVHNGHAGDAHYSNMADGGYTSTGEILRKDFGRDKIFCVGFGTYKGFVTAGYIWNGPLQEIRLLPAKDGSWESILHQLGAENKIILSKDIRNNKTLNKWIEFRSVGAAFSGAAVYGRSIMSERFDSFIFIDSTTALHPLERTNKNN